MTDPGSREDAEPAPAVSPWRKRLRWLILVSGTAGLVLVTRQALGADESAVPSARAAGAAFVLQAVGGMAAARAWAELLGADGDRAHIRGAMYESQLSKYIPAGGLVQAAGQVTLSTSPGVSVRRSAFVWVTSVVLTVVAGAWLLGAFALLGGLTGWARAVAVLGLLTPLLVDQRQLAWLLTHGHRLTARIPEPRSLPTRRALRVALLWTTLGFAMIAAGFTVLLVDLDTGVSAIDALAAFVVGWLVGFLLVPLPAGLGAREAVLVALIPGSTTGVVLAASLGQRVIAFAAEVVLVVGHRLHRRRAAARRPPSGEAQRR